MTNSAKLCKSCGKEAKTLRHGYCDKCLAIHVVKDWLKKDGVKDVSMGHIKTDPDYSVPFNRHAWSDAEAVELVDTVYASLPTKSRKS